MNSETSKIRTEVLPFCRGRGLDLGCGHDKICPEAIGFDLPTPYTPKGESIEMRGNAQSLPFNDGVLDYIYSSHLLEDFEDTKTVVTEWLRVLKPGGLLVLYLPDEKVYREFCARTGHGHNSQHRIVDMSLTYMRNIMNGFSVSEVMAMEHHADYSFLLVMRKNYLTCMNGVFSIGTPTWDNSELKESIREFIPLFRNRPLIDNYGGMGFVDMFYTWFTLRKLKPSTVVEVGVFKGQGTWLIEQTLPEAEIHSVDVTLSMREYKSARAKYHECDPTKIDWSGLPKEQTLFHFDDHQDADARLDFVVSNGFHHVVFSDNYAVGLGNCMSMKKGFENKAFCDRMVPMMKLYYEFPPFMRTVLWRDKKPWTFPTPVPLFRNSSDVPQEAVQDVENGAGYTSFCLVRV